MTLKELIENMKVHEEEHSEYFEKEINKRNIKPLLYNKKKWNRFGIINS